jgi:hypothetical protein
LARAFPYASRKKGHATPSLNGKQMYQSRIGQWFGGNLSIEQSFWVNPPLILGSSKDCLRHGNKRTKNRLFGNGANQAIGGMLT